MLLVKNLVKSRANGQHLVKDLANYLGGAVMTGDEGQEQEVYIDRSLKSAKLLEMHAPYSINI